MRHWIIRVSLLFTVLIGWQIGMSLKVKAVTDSGENFESIGDNRHYKIGSGESLDGLGPEIERWPAVVTDKKKVPSIFANHVINGRITEDTTEIKIYLNQNLVSSTSNSNSLQHVRVALFKTEQTGEAQLIATDNIDDGVIASGNYVPFAHKGAPFVFTLPKNQLSLPLKVGFQIQTTGKPNQWVSYSIGEIYGDTIVKPTITSKLTPESTKIVGTGTSGNTITSNINANSVKVSDGHYELALNTTLAGHLKSEGRPPVIITERNIFGDSATVSQQQLRISKALDDQTFKIENTSQYDSGTTNAQIIEDLRKQLKINVDGNISGVEYIGKIPGSQNGPGALANAINNQQDGTTLVVKIFARKPGYIQSDDVTVNITKNKANLIFMNKKETLDFGTHTLPMQKQSIWSNEVWSMKVTDERRNQQTDWKLTAKATPVPTVTKTQNIGDLSNFLWYSDGKQSVPLNCSQEILSSGMQHEGNEFEREFNAKNRIGIFVNASPQMAPTAYQATITWTLQIAPLSGHNRG